MVVHWAEVAPSTLGRRKWKMRGDMSTLMVEEEVEEETELNESQWRLAPRYSTATSSQF